MSTVTGVILNPDEMKFRISITMTLKEWNEFRSQLDKDTWPSWDVAGKIREITDVANEMFYAKDNEPWDDKK